ncbi:unnamed protein product [Cylicocyclus nassatus]|uniref:Uncharacterized protein n=1 Tax=Cylicocyclus nassatus TaxID=53992 RepID=A0AA36H2M3_CYLNA|nr:unnamed protein product [Cylicocyclus nassatus]
MRPLDVGVDNKNWYPKQMACIFYDLQCCQYLCWNGISSLRISERARMGESKAIRFNSLSCKHQD